MSNSSPPKKLSLCQTAVLSNRQPSVRVCDGMEVCRGVIVRESDLTSWDVVQMKFLFVSLRPRVVE